MEMPGGMMAQPASQWANRSSHGQLPPVSFLSVENLLQRFAFYHGYANPNASTLQMPYTIPLTPMPSCY